MKHKVLILSSTEAKSIAEAIQVNLQDVADCTIWDQGFYEPSIATLNTLIDLIPEYDYGIVILTGDDVVETRNKKLQAPRDNVILELGLLYAKLGIEHSFILYDKATNPKIPSNLFGINVIGFQLNSAKDPRPSLAPACYEIKSAIEKRGPRIDVQKELEKKLQKLRKKLEEAHKEIKETKKGIPGKRLFEHEGYYPIDINKKGRPSLNHNIFIKAINFFAE